MTVKKPIGGGFLRSALSLNMFSAGKYTFKTEIITGLVKNLEILILAQFVETNSNTYRLHPGYGHFTFRLGSLFPVFSIDLVLFTATLKSRGKSCEAFFSDQQQ